MTSQASVRRRIAATTAVVVAAFGLMGATRAPSRSTDQPTCTASHVGGPARVGRISGIARPQPVGASCPSRSVAAQSTYPGSPPLINHGGHVMGTPSAGDQVVVTPIFWAPSGFSFTDAYRTVISTYLADLAA